MADIGIERELPLVSVVMPAYKGKYLEKALRGVCDQTYRPLELIICDDARDDEVRRVVEKIRPSMDFKIVYNRNEQRLREMRSTAKALELASGKYIKPLHDDDVLHADCIASLVDVMESEPSVALASSRRRRIDEEDNPLPDMLATFYPFHGDVIINGVQLVSFLCDYTINFIGEPSTILCRREDLLQFGEKLSTLNDVRITWIADLAIYAKLLQIGDLAMLAKPLTDFRVSSDQYSQIGRNTPGIGDKGHADFRKAVRDLGWYRAAGDNAMVDVAPITNLKARVFRPINLWSAIQRAAGLGNVPLSAWLSARVPSNVQSQFIHERLETAAGALRIAIAVFAQEVRSDATALTLNSLKGVHRYLNLDVHFLYKGDKPVIGKDIQYRSIGAEGLARSLNDLAAATDAVWLLVVEAGAEFTKCGLLSCALELLGAPDSFLAVYADEVMRFEDGERGVALRPDLNLDLMLSFPSSLSRHWLLRREALLEQGGFASDAGSAFELDYQLRLIERIGLGCIGHISEPLLTSEAFSLKDSPDERAVIERHLHNRGYEQARVGSQLPGRYEVDYGHLQQASVSILVVVNGRLAQVQRCMDTVLAHTQYANYEVLLIDHGNDLPEVREWLAGVEAVRADQLRVVRFDRTTSHAAVRNQAAEQARGDYLLWLGDGAGIMAGDWLPQLLNHGLRPEVGAVGAKLLSADGKVRHAGLLLGLNGPAGRAFEGASFEDAGYMQRLQVDQNYSALSGECLLIRRELFQQAGGFDESPLLSRWTDVDLCLKLQQAGYLNVWTPRVQVLMDSDQPALPSAAEEDAMYARWLPVLARDPASNSGFSAQKEPGFKLAEPHLSWLPLQSWKPVPLVLAHHADRHGCGHYRMIQPFNAMRDAGLADGALSLNVLSPVELERFSPDIIVLQRQVGEDRLEAMRRMKAFSPAFKVYELDDYLPNLPMKSVHREHMPKDILKTLRRGLSYVDRFVVSTQPLAEAFSGIHSDIRVIENRLPGGWWRNQKSVRRTGAKPRVGWAGGSSHTGDLELIADVVKELASDVEWVFFGMCPDKLRPYVHEFHAGVAINQYPAMLASLNLDLALAPVEQNLFNECKSNLRLLEYGACGFPVIASDVRCYQGGSLPVTLVKNRFRDWVDAIRMHLSDLDAAARMGDELREAVMKDWMLEGVHLQAWRRAWSPD